MLLELPGALEVRMCQHLLDGEPLSRILVETTEHQVTKLFASVVNGVDSLRQDRIDVGCLLPFPEQLFTRAQLVDKPAQGEDIGRLRIHDSTVLRNLGSDLIMRQGLLTTSIFVLFKPLNEFSGSQINQLYIALFATPDVFSSQVAMQNIMFVQVPQSACYLKYYAAQRFLGVQSVVMEVLEHFCKGASIHVFKENINALVYVYIVDLHDLVTIYPS